MTKAPIRWICPRCGIVIEYMEGNAQLGKDTIDVHDDICRVVYLTKIGWREYIKAKVFKK